MRTPEYEDYLMSPAWQHIRSRRLQFDRWRCRNCHVTDGLQVHHWYYSRDGRSILGREELEDVVTLCDACHVALTVRRQRVFGTGPGHRRMRDGWMIVVLILATVFVLWVVR